MMFFRVLVTGTLSVFTFAGCGSDGSGHGSGTDLDADTDTDADVDSDTDTDIDTDTTSESDSETETETDTDTDCQYPTVVESCTDGWCLIEPGCFTMGSPETEPGHGNYGDETQHEVTLTRQFLMKATEVTQDEWFVHMGTNPAFYSECGGSCPVEDVNWLEMIVFCNTLSLSEDLVPCYADPDDATDYDTDDAVEEKTPDWPLGLDCEGYRLPTEAEWEYAARAGTTTAFYTGPITAADPTICDMDMSLNAAGWYCGNANDGTHPVAEKEPNGWGLYDIHGNVWENVWDWYEEYGGPATDPTGPTTGMYRSTRSGAWNTVVVAPRSATRVYSFQTDDASILGFRVARTAL